MESVTVASNYQTGTPATERGPEETGAAADLLARLREEPWTFEFFQAMRLFEELYPDRLPVGGFGNPGDEVVRLRAATGISFPPSELSSIDNAPDGGPPRMTVSFMGLTGPQGVLPSAYSLLLVDRARAGDQAMRDFLGMFDHRMLSLFYRAWARSRAHVGRERAGRGGDDWLTLHLHDLLGTSVDNLRASIGLPGQDLLRYTGLLAMPTRPASALEQILADYFAVPATIEQFVGAWYPLERSAQCALGDDDDASSQLGLGAVAGDEIWDQQSRVRVRLGPLTRRQYDDFLPGGGAHEPLRALTRFFGNDEVDFEVQLVLARDDVPGVTLGDGVDGSEPPPLGWCTWLRTAPLGRDPDDTILTL